MFYSYEVNVVLATLGVLACFVVILGVCVLAGWGLSVILDLEFWGGVYLFWIWSSMFILLVLLARGIAENLVTSGYM